jgi:hypothetical protein
MSNTYLFLCHLAFWFVTVFATPLFIALNNSADVAVTLAVLSLILAAATGATSLAGYGLTRLLAPEWRERTACLLLGLAFVLAVQGNVVHDFFYYGNFSGERVDFRGHGRGFWYEWAGFLAGVILIPALLMKFRPRAGWLPLLPMASSLLLLTPALLDPPPGAVEFKGDKEVDASVFEFSRNGNIIHLLPDGFQADIAQEVLETNPELAARMDGFTFFSNHLGLFQGTAPALSTMFTGEPFPLERGHDYQWVVPFIREHGYPPRLKAAGYRVDMVPLASAYCPEQADSCHHRPFNDMKPRGYFRHRNAGLSYSLRLIADLSLFRMTPMWLKEKIYDDGHWFISDTTMDGSSPWPDPVIREWIDNLQVTDGPPVYKWYHYVGSHIPPLWDAECVYRRGLERSRENFAEQTLCILEGIARLADALRQNGIYAQTSIVITGDHGCGVAPYDYAEEHRYLALDSGMVGTARPAFMAKPAGASGPIRYSQAPTALVDVEPTVMSLAGLEDQGVGLPAFEIGENLQRTRYFKRYSSRELWGSDPVPHSVHRVDGDVRDGRNWKIADLFPYRPVPERYTPVNYRNGRDFIQGARWDTVNPDKEASWVNGNQLAFLITAPGGPGLAHTLKLAVHQPDWLPENLADIHVNGRLLGEDLEVRVEKGYWAELSVAVPAEVLRDGSNFVSVEFDRTANPPNIDHWEAASLIQSIWLTPAPVANTSTAAAGRP